MSNLQERQLGENDTVKKKKEKSAVGCQTFTDLSLIH